MVMKGEDIIKALGRLEMKGGMHMIPEELRGAIIAALSAPAEQSAPVAEKPRRGRPPLNKGAQPE